MSRTKSIFISDVHVGRRKKPKSGSHMYDWFSGDEVNAFEGFLGYLNRRKDIREIIFLGDILDNWVCPIDETPPTMEEIIEDNKNSGIKEKLRALRDNPEILVHYIVGNHDMGVTPEFIKKYFTGRKLKKNRKEYKSGLLHAEHGHLYGMFNAPDPVNSSEYHLPMGYYITRIETSIKAKTGKVPSDNIITYLYDGVDDLFEAASEQGQTLAMSVIEAVSEEYHKRVGGSRNLSIVMPEEYGGGVKKISDIKAEYKNLYEQWKNKYGGFRAMNSILADLHALKPMAERLIRGKTKFVLFGHSHKVRLINIEGESFNDIRGYYINSGCWCDGLEKLSFLETDLDNEGKFSVWRQCWKWDKERGKGKIVKRLHHKRSVYV